MKRLTFIVMLVIGQAWLNGADGTNAMRGQAAPAPITGTRPTGIERLVGAAATTNVSTATNEMVIEADGGFEYEATNWSFSAVSIIDVPLLAGKLQEPADTVSSYLKSQLSAATLQSLTAYPTQADGGPLQAGLARDFNLISSKGIYEPQRFAGVTLRPETLTMITNKPQGDALFVLNRLLLEDAYPGAISRTHPPTATYRVNVHVMDPQMELYCELLRVYFATNNSIDIILAETNVVMMEKDRWAIGDKAVYTATNELVEVTGHVVVDDVRGHGATERVIFDRKKGTLFIPTPLRMSITTSTNAAMPTLFGTKKTNAAPVRPGKM